MISAEMDKKQLQKSLRKFSKSFGENNSQAVVRWSVHTCRELAFEAQPWGKRGTKNIQKSAILADLYRVMFVVDKVGRSSSNKKLIKDAGGVISWMDLNKGKGKRTRKLSVSEKKICSKRVANAAVRIKMKNAGIAKGGFLGAGKEIARSQKGSQKVTIGKNYFGYAQKHSRFGTANKPKSGIKPTAKLTNKASHTSQDYVIKKTAIKKAVRYGLKKTIKWYQMALRRQNKKQK